MNAFLMGDRAGVRALFEEAAVLAADGVHVARRAADGAWRVAISLLAPPDRTEKEQP